MWLTYPFVAGAIADRSRTMPAMKGTGGAGGAGGAGGGAGSTGHLNAVGTSNVTLGISFYKAPYHD